MRRKEIVNAVLLSTLVIGGGAPVHAQAQQAMHIEEIMVTARRREERIQDVPVSMTVLSQQQLSNYNISNAGEIALYTPSLSTNSRWGDELATFAIRGFTQESRTTASVGVYFADVVSPRGASSQTSGDGAGPGMFFDLENIQVLKGPQGTLFGRNTTGGAVLLMPRKPTDQFEGYVEASAGNYDLRQLQGVVNIPVSDRFRMRFGVDSKEREGHLRNVGSAGPSRFNNVDYMAARASAVVDITDTLENYTILTYTESDTNNSFPTITHCNSTALGGGMFGGLLGDMCQAQLDRQAAAGHTGFWDTASSLPNPRSEMEEWRAINTTTWQVTDDFAIKNIISYARLETQNNSPVWGSDDQFQPFMMPPGHTIPYRYAAAGARGDGVNTTDMSSFVEELQFQGLAFDERLTWQAGLYYEKSKPDGPMGQASPVNISCDYATLQSSNIQDWRCNDVVAGLSILQLVQGGILPPEAYGNEAAYLGAPLKVGNVMVSDNGLEYTNKAAYAQGTFEFTDRFSVTAGLRYTSDKTTGFQHTQVIRFPYDPLTGAMFAPEAVEIPPSLNGTQKSEKPTWLLGAEYKPSEDMMLYAKYSRGYRQGSINPASQPGLEMFGPEKVDTYEVGLKSSFSGTLNGTFNAALFYNDFQDQQLQNGIVLSQEYSGVGSTAIVNAGKSTIQGVELDGTLHLGNLTLSGGYTYLDTEVKELDDISARIIATGATPASLAAAEGDTLPYAPKHNLVLTANYHLPVPAELGDIQMGATYVYSDSVRASASNQYSPFNELPSYEIVNLHLNWLRIANSAFDLSAFVTNVTNEEYYVFATGNFAALENESALPGHPRMFGVRLRYSFGAAHH